LTTARELDPKGTSSAGRIIVRATALIVVMGLLSKLTGLVRDTVIAHQFGATGLTDAYVVASTIPTLVFSMITGALAVVVVPVFTAYLAAGEEEKAWRVFASVTTWLFLLLAGFTLLGMVFSRLFVHLVAPGFAPATAALAVQLTYIMFPLLLFTGMSNLFTGLSNANNIFGVPAFAAVANNLVIIGAALFLAGRFGIRGLALGTALAMAAAALVQLPPLFRAGFRFGWSLHFRDPGLVKLVVLMVPVAIGLSANQAYVVIDRVLASGLNAGSLSALNYAQKVMLVPVGLFVTALGTAVYPTITRLAARARMDELRDTLLRALRAVFLVIVPSAVVLGVLARPVVTLLFERGAFDAHAAVLTATALAFYAVGLAGQAGVVLLTRAFYALEDTRTPVYITVAAVLINLVLSLVLIRPMQLGGLALANSLGALANTGLLIWLLDRRVAGLKNALLGFLLRVGLAALPMGAVSYAVYGATAALTNGSGLWSAAAGLTLAGVAGLLVFVLIVRGLGLEEVGLLAAYVRRVPLPASGLFIRRPR